MAVPKYREISEKLAREIRSGKYKNGQKFPSEAALVKKFGASRITVGHAVRELQQSGLLDRVAGSGTYVRAAGIRDRAGLLFGLVIPNLGETEIFEPICQAIAGAPEAAGHGLLWPQADPEVEKLCRQCIERKVDGVFFAPLELSERSTEVNRRVMKMLAQAGIPVILLDRQAGAQSGQRCDLVGIDNHRAGYLAAEHLLQVGARRIGFLAYNNQAGTVAERIRGYSDVTGMPEVFRVDSGERIALPDGVLRCDALVCANDRIAGQSMHALIARGARVPQDMRIVGIDDVNYATLLPVPLTTVHQPCRDIGETALRMMLDRLERPKMPARQVLLDCHLVVRESCGANSLGLPVSL
jgi:GntR family transcriptional regulator, arabinose operon transcriptional repressor